MSYKFIIIRRHQKGLTLLESIISVLLISIVAAAILGGFSTSYKGEITADQQYQAEALARGQIDSIQKQNFIDYSQSGHGTYDPVTAPALYTVQLSVTPISNEEQLITVNVLRNGSTIRTLSDYKVNR